MKPPLAAAHRHRGERGSGLLSAVFGVGLVLATLAVATQLCVGLMARSHAEAVAWETARRVATAPVGTDPTAARAEALSRADAALGDGSATVHLAFEASPPDRVVLRVRTDGVRLLPAMVSGGSFAALDRRIVVMRESP